MADTNPIAIPPNSIPTISVTTIPIAGLQVDIYGLSELSPEQTQISCLWLQHPRLRRKEDMADTAHLILSTFHAKQKQKQQKISRGLIAIAFDQRNHGTRLLDNKANEAWRKGNKTHAQDMFATVSGTAGDTSHLLDVVEAYVFNDDNHNNNNNRSEKKQKKKKKITQHLALGVSLGGHVVWHLMFREPRIEAGVIVIGCPDYQFVMKDRARLSKLESYHHQEEDQGQGGAGAGAGAGASFIGGPDFPPGLVEACKLYDPKSILFGTGPITGGDDAGSDPSEEEEEQEQARLRGLMDARIRGKRFQVLSGGKDKLVPYRASKPFLDFFKRAVGTWYKDGGVYVQDNVYDDAGHEFNKAMGKDALKFILESISLADSKEAAVAAAAATASSSSSSSASPKM